MLKIFLVFIENSDLTTRPLFLFVKSDQAYPEVFWGEYSPDSRVAADSTLISWRGGLICPMK